MTDMNHSDALQNPVLIVNCGSSSIKYALIGADATHRIEGLAENLGTPDARIKHKSATGDKSEISIPDADHTQALQSVLEQLGDVTPVAVGHRVVHGATCLARRPSHARHLGGSQEFICPCPATQPSQFGRY